MPLKNWCSMQDGWKAVWSIPYVSVAFFPSLKHNFIAYCSSKVFSHPDSIFEIHQLWQSGFSRVYSNCCCSCSFEAEIIKICQSSHKMYINNIVNFQESMAILNACTKKSGNLLNAPCTFTKGICPKVNVIAWLGFELTFYNVKVQHVNHYCLQNVLFQYSKYRRCCTSTNLCRTKNILLKKYQDTLHKRFSNLNLHSLYFSITLPILCLLGYPVYWGCRIYQLCLCTNDATC